MQVDGLLIRAEFYEAVLVGPEQQLLAAVHVELTENVGEVVANGDAGNAETFRNVLVRQCQADQTNDLLLTTC